MGNQSHFQFSGLVDPPAEVTGETEKEAGIKKAANARLKNRILQEAREIAKKLPAAKTTGITADDVVEKLVENGYGIHALGNAAGSLFRGGDWECIGRRKSTRVHAHANELRVWRLKS